MTRDEIKSLFLPIFEQIYKLLKGQIESVMAADGDSRIKVASFIRLITLDCVHGWRIWIE